MSAAHSEPSRDKKSHSLHQKRTKRHHFRTVLLLSLALTILVLWQLNPIIRAVGDVQQGLQQAEGTRRILGGVLTIAYDKIKNLVLPLIHQLWGHHA